MADRTGFYRDCGIYGQEYLGRDVSEALDILSSGDIDRVVHDHVYVDWEIDREAIASAVAYEGLLDYTKERVAEDALEKIRDDTDAECGPVYGGVYWWEAGWSASPRPPADAICPPQVNVRWTANAKPKASSNRRPKSGKAKASVSKPKASDNARPKRTTAKKPTAKKTTGRR